LSHIFDESAEHADGDHDPDSRVDGALGYVEVNIATKLLLDTLETIIDEIESRMGKKRSEMPMRTPLAVGGHISCVRY
jgi:hypothetical protein